ncbi:MAG TPA: DMT family transporter [Casimicrobiaceae bacterium]|nr:DMT family transporter [Casimicrobiaceae bacterium]
MTTGARARVALHTAAVLFGLTGVIGAWLDLPALEITLVRCVVGALALWAIARRRHEPLVPTRALVANGALLAVHWTSFFAAVAAGGVAVGSLGYASFPLFVVLFERVLAGRTLDHAGAVTVALVSLGLATMAWPGMAVPGLVAGLAWGVASGASFAWLSVRVRLHLAGATPVALAFGQCAFAALWLLPVVAVTGSMQVPTPAQGAGLLVLGVACTAIAHTLFIGALRAVSAHTASVIVALEPVYAIALAAMLLRQVPGTTTLAGGALVICAAVVASRRGAVAPPI